MKSTKSIKSIKSTKRTQATFLLLYVFYVHKKHKKQKKAQNVKQAIFFLLDVFMCIRMLSFLVLFACMHFVLSVRVKSSYKKKIIIKRFKVALIPSFTILLSFTINSNSAATTAAELNLEN